MAFLKRSETVLQMVKGLGPVGTIGLMLFSCQGGYDQPIEAPQELTADEQRTRQDCTEDGDCPSGEVCELSTGFCRDATYYGETPEWGLSLTFDDPIFPEIDQVDEQNDRSNHREQTVNGQHPNRQTNQTACH